MKMQRSNCKMYAEINPLPPSGAAQRCRPAVPFGNRKYYFRSSLFSIVTNQKVSHSGNLKFNYLGVFQSLQLRISMGKNPFN